METLPLVFSWYPSWFSVSACYHRIPRKRALHAKAHAQRERERERERERVNWGYDTNKGGGRLEEEAKETFFWHRKMEPRKAKNQNHAYRSLAKQ
jgi:hypothetical protein